MGIHSEQGNYAAASYEIQTDRELVSDPVYRRVCAHTRSKVSDVVTQIVPPKKRDSNKPMSFSGSRRSP
jgi:hypothetical protein